MAQIFICVFFVFMAINPNNIPVGGNSIWNTGTVGQANSPLPASINPQGIAPVNLGGGLNINSSGNISSGPVYGPPSPTSTSATVPMGTTYGPPSPVVGGGGSGADLAAIEDAYNQYNQALEQQKVTTTAQYGQGKESIGNQYNQAIGDINAQKKTGVENLQNATSTVNQSSQNAVADARRAYNELQQRNQAYLSAGGISSSSASEAMQEGLSKQTLQALNNITQNKDQTLQNITTQQQSLQDFYDRQIANLNTGLADAKKQIDLQMNAALDTINTNQAMAARDKAMAKNQLLAQAAAANQAAQQQAQQIQANLNSFNQIKQQVFGNFAGYANGQISLQDFAKGIKQANDTLRGSGVQLNTAAIASGISNPYVAASTNNWFVPYDPNAGLQTNILQQQLTQLQGQNKAAGY